MTFVVPFVTQQGHPVIGEEVRVIYIGRTPSSLGEFKMTPVPKQLSHFITKMRTIFFLFATLPLVSADIRGWLRGELVTVEERQLLDGEEAVLKEFEGIEVIPEENSNEENASHIDRDCWEKIRNGRVTVGIKKEKYQV
jgi:hypothetical protein